MQQLRSTRGLILVSIAVTAFLVRPSHAQSQQAQRAESQIHHAIVFRGKVSDAKTGEGIAKALVSIRTQSLGTITDATGAFSFPQVVPGEVELYVSTVGYELLKTRLQIPGDRDFEADIYLGQQASKHRETITVRADPFDSIQPSVASSSNTLDKTELKNLATVVVDDPIRSVQTLPGVTSTDDYHAQFSLRGSGFSHIGVYVDGILVSSPFHTAEDIQQSGSATFFNSDVVDSLELISSGFPAQYGDRTGAVLDIHTREGSSEGIFTRADIGMAGLSFTNEGPIFKSKKASWLISARKSYLGTLMREWGAQYLAVGYSDFQGKLNFHPNSSNEITLSSMLGSGWVEPASDSIRYSHIKKGDSATALASLIWNWVLNSNARLHTQLAFVQEKAWNHDQQNQTPFESRARDLSGQQELGLQLPAGHSLSAGWSVRRESERTESDYYDLYFTNFLISAHYSKPAWYSSAYLQDLWQIVPGRLQVNVGGRTEHFTPTGQTLWMPRASMAIHITRDDKLTLSWGQYGQFPEFRQLYGEVYNPNLRAERGTHYVAGLEHRLNDRTRIRVEAYEVRLQEGIYTPDQEWRMPRPLDLERRLAPVNGLLQPRLGPFQRNSLSGHTRGVEFTLQRRSANRLSGWISYAYGYSRYADPADELSFWGDYDQRHTVNVYGSYRITNTMNLSSKYRFGTNFPVPGFYASAGSTPSLSDQRNQIRMPDYSRLDLRFSKAIYKEKRKLTFYTEVGNVFNRSNQGCQVASIIQSIPSCNNEFPVLPSAGLTMEF